MHPRIHHVRSVDGTTLAYWTLGEGRPLVYLAGGPWAHVELWPLPACRDWTRRLALSHRVIRYDERGTGRSAREVADFSLGAHVADLMAVVDALGLERFDLFAAANAGPVAIAFAARHAGRVQRLVLWCAWARTAELDSPRLEAWRGMLERDWTQMSETCAHLALGWSGGEAGRRSAAQLRASIDRATARTALAGSGRHDATASLASVRAPALVIHRRDIEWLPPALARRLAAALPKGELVLLEGESTAPYLDDGERVLDNIERFLAPEAKMSRSNDAPRARHRARARGREQGLPITPREREVLALLAEGSTNREIATLLGVSVRTVDRHVENLYAKLGARGRVEATTRARDRGML